MNELKKFYEDKTILVTGGIGSIGREIVRSILKYNPKVIRVLDNNETGLFELQYDLQTKKIRTFVGDTKDKERLRRAIEDVDIVFHAAALKHVPLCEYNPFEAVKTNVIGTQNLVDVAMDEEVEKLITISTDKAVNPVNVMGATKLLAERLTVSANLYKGDREIAFSSVRFGNVLYSRGSVLPLFEEQIKKGFITLTDSRMTRFIMNISQAVELILKAVTIGSGGEIFILKMPVVGIKDLVEVFIDEFASKYGYAPDQIEIQNIGKRVGEKLYEELMTEDEAENAYESEEMFVVLPQNSVKSHMLPGNFKKTQQNIYSSHNTNLLTKEEIRSLLIELNHA